MQKLQEQYLFLVRHDIHNVVDLALTVENLTDKKKAASKDKSRVYRSKEKCKTIFEIADAMQELVPAENCFQKGDNFFADEHQQWMNLNTQLEDEGYSLEEVEQLRLYYKEQFRIVSSKEKAVFKELNLGKAILRDVAVEDADRIRVEELRKDKTEERDKKQPVR